jgi:hypothetical protein
VFEVRFITNSFYHREKEKAKNMKLILTIALASTQATIHRAPRQAEDYDGDFPSTITARRSMFDMPRYKQGMSADLLRKYKHMESMIQFYDQSLNNITKYWTYGCWCFQMGDFPLRLGNGSPVDGVDKNCKKQKECYRCAKKDNMEQFGKTCLPDETKYKFKAQYDKVTGAPYVDCLNPVGSCQRNICECDKAFASKLQGAAEDPADGWTEAHHAHYGGFDSRNQCLRKLGKPADDKELVCCGDYPDRYMYRVNKDETGRQCCGKKLYDSDTHECCDDKIVSSGTC